MGRPLPPIRPSLIQIGLFILTVGSTLLVGALHDGADLDGPRALLRGVPFAAALLSILFVHEMGHYLTARGHGVEVTLPYFIPAPTLLGTFGAFIRIRSAITDRRALLAIGAAGPIAGFLVAVPVLWIGISTSVVTQVPPEATLELGESLLMKGLIRLIHGSLPPGQDLLLNAVGLAGWAGILVTALNLLPLGQLDGGHVAYALFGRGSRWIALPAIGIMLGMSFLWPGWIVWCLLAILFGLRHPPLQNPHRPLRRRDWVLGAAALILLLICFTPVPLRLNG
jgi:membrane-associated protease RseP (regulator of RpoE activity)